MRVGHRRHDEVVDTRKVHHSGIDPALRLHLVAVLGEVN
jgi:hypothetical protein